MAVGGGAKRPGRDRQAVEWPTVLLAATIYGGWLALTACHEALPAWIAWPALTWLVAWHSSLQHEIIHGHPTRWRRLNRALGSVPLSFWVPFESYRISHLRHHRDERLTDPLDDPESFYWSPEQWAALSTFERKVVEAQMTLAGRLLIGPAWSVWRFWRSEWALVAAGDSMRARIWRAHALLAAGTLAWLVLVCGINPLAYFLGVVYPATALLLIRSFAEHRAEEGVSERTAIVENAWLLGPLFLFNNLHAAHHAAPMLPWYRIPGWYRANRAALLAANGDLVYDGYLDVARRYFFRVYDHPAHPLLKASGEPVIATV